MSKEVKIIILFSYLRQWFTLI